MITCRNPFFIRSVFPALDDPDGQTDVNSSRNPFFIRSVFPAHILKIGWTKAKGRNPFFIRSVFPAGES